MISIALVTAGCARRPVRNDVNTPEGPPTRQGNADSEINSSPRAIDAPFELQFIDTTIELDLNAIDAAQLVATRAEHEELKQFSRKLIAERQGEIATLRQLRSTWFSTRPKAIYLELSGAPEAFHALDIGKLDPMKENAFDLEFIGQMTSFLGPANRMTSDLLTKDARPELKQIAQSILRSNELELEQLKKWEIDWQKT